MFFSPDGGYATRLFEDETLERWIDFRDRTSFKTGDRYTTFDLFRIQDQVLSWLKDRGYAFARLKTETLIDSTARTADSIPCTRVQKKAGNPTGVFYRTNRLQESRE